MSSVVFDQPVPLSRMRRAVVRTVEASAAVPQFALEREVPFVALAKRREHERAISPLVSITDVIHAAVARALAAHPALNSSYSPEGITTHSQVGLAYLVEASGGLLAPVIADAANQSHAELARERVRLGEAVTSGTIGLEDLEGATFTVSNLGPTGVHRFTALVMPGQAAVLAVGSRTPAGGLVLTLACDHRAVDGAPAGRFLADLALLLEDDGEGAAR